MPDWNSGIVGGCGNTVAIDIQETVTARHRAAGLQEQEHTVRHRAAGLREQEHAVRHRAAGLQEQEI